MRRISLIMGAVASAALLLTTAGNAVGHRVTAHTATLTTYVLRFNELPPQPVNGLSFQHVTFGFTIGGSASTDATYDANDGGKEKYVKDPSLEGNAQGTLTLTFDNPTPLVRFGVARSTTMSLTPGCTVQLYDANGKLFKTKSVNTQVYVTFSEGKFSWSSTTKSVKEAVITFPDSTDAARFAIDNLTYEQ